MNFKKTKTKLTSFFVIVVFVVLVKGFLREAKLIQEQQGLVGVCVVNAGFVNLTKSWLCNVKEFGSHKYTLMIATDRQAFDELDRFRRLRKMQFALALHEIDDRALTTSLSITQVAYWKWLVFRVELLKTLISNSIDVLLFETDAVWFKCAFDEWRKERISSKSVAVDIFGVADGSSARQMGFGFLRIRSNQRTKALWTTLDSRFRDAVSKLHTDKDAARVQSEQAILNELLKNSESTTKNAVSYSMLPRSEYVDGSFYSDDIRRNSCPTPVLINNNFIVGVEAKVERARKWNHYFLDRNSLCIDATLLSQTLGISFCFSFFRILIMKCCRWMGATGTYEFTLERLLSTLSIFRKVVSML